MDCGSWYFGPLAMILRDFHCLFCLDPSLVTWQVGLYLNGELWQVLHVYRVHIKQTQIRNSFLYVLSCISIRHQSCLLKPQTVCNGSLKKSKSLKDRQYNDQAKTDNNTAMIHKTLHTKLKFEIHETPRDELRCSRRVFSSCTANDACNIQTLYC